MQEKEQELPKSVEEPKNEEPKKVNVQEYAVLNSDIVLISYTATWCGPCRRIKPVFLEIIKDKTAEISNEEILKDYYKENIHPFVPFFVVKNESGQFSDCIQTSDEKLLKDFLNKYINPKPCGIPELDEDF